MERHAYSLSGKVEPGRLMQELDLAIDTGSVGLRYQSYDCAAYVFTVTLENGELRHYVEFNFSGSAEQNRVLSRLAGYRNVEKLTIDRVEDPDIGELRRWLRRRTEEYDISAAGPVFGSIADTHREAGLQ